MTGCYTWQAIVHLFIDTDTEYP
ncbi:hypothetical protein HU200_024635 [Digitaria exilis]|uniref:Uncharacterized protein n=1 Tax=Digitaria exilis TaxID=1010633 RepID=A0A835CBW5_9POAL|nr:hypothetical protein HU200_024635 [Digitaria exilis]